MIVETSSILTQRALRSAIRTDIFVRIEAIAKDTGASTSVTFWDGMDNISINLVGYGTNDCFGVGRLLNVPDFQYETGLDVKTYEIGLSHADDLLRDVIIGHDIRQAPVQIFRCEWNRYNRIGNPRIIFKGFVDGSPMVIPELQGENGGISLKIVSDAHALTRYGNSLKNNEFQKRRNNDEFRKYSSVRIASAPWGMEKRQDNNVKQGTSQTKGIF